MDFIDYAKPTEAVVTANNGVLTPLFAVETPCVSALIIPLAANVGVVTVGYSTTPITQGGYTLPAIPGPTGFKRYDLSKLNMKNSNNGDGVEVIYFN